MSYEYKVFHKETGEEIHEENFSQYFSQYIALDSDGDLVEIDSRDAVVVSVVDFAYIKFNKTGEYEAKAKAWDELSASIRRCNKEIEVKGGLNALFRTSKKGQIVQRHIDCFESGEPNEL